MGRRLVACELNCSCLWSTFSLFRNLIDYCVFLSYFLPLIFFSLSFSIFLSHVRYLPHNVDFIQQLLFQCLLGVSPKSTYLFPSIPHASSVLLLPGGREDRINSSTVLWPWAKRALYLWRHTQSSPAILLCPRWYPWGYFPRYTEAQTPIHRLLRTQRPSSGTVHIWRISLTAHVCHVLWKLLRTDRRNWPTHLPAFVSFLVTEQNQPSGEHFVTESDRIFYFICAAESEFIRLGFQFGKRSKKSFGDILTRSYRSECSKIGNFGLLGVVIYMVIFLYSCA